MIAGSVNSSWQIISHKTIKINKENKRSYGAVHNKLTYGSTLSTLTSLSTFIICRYSLAAPRWAPIYVVLMW